MWKIACFDKQLDTAVGQKAPSPLLLG